MNRDPKLKELNLLDSLISACFRVTQLNKIICYYNVGSRNFYFISQDQRTYFKELMLMMEVGDKIYIYF